MRGEAIFFSLFSLFVFEFKLAPGSVSVNLAWVFNGSKMRKYLSIKMILVVPQKGGRKHRQRIRVLCRAPMQAGTNLEGGKMETAVEASGSKTCQN